MQRRAAAAIFAAGTLIVVIAVSSAGSRPAAQDASAAPLALPSPVSRGSVSLGEALAGRRSVREYSAEALTPAEIGQLLWAAQGVTSDDGRRTAPAGHAAQNLLLEAVALGLGSVPVGSFDDAAVARLVGLEADEVPLYLLPVGRPR